MGIITILICFLLPCLYGLILGSIYCNEKFYERVSFELENNHKLSIRSDLQEDNLIINSEESERSTSKLGINFNEIIAWGNLLNLIKEKTGEYAREKLLNFRME